MAKFKKVIKAKKEKKEKRKKRRGAPKGKGSGFERDTCKQLSIWWTNGDDDAFWRSSNSGGRATVRGRKGKRTASHYGDITNTDSRGAPLLDLWALELKRGYKQAILHDLLDRPSNINDTIWESWIKQAKASSELSGSYSWAIIAKRDRRETIIVMEEDVAEELSLFGIGAPSARFDITISIKGKNTTIYREVPLFVMGFNMFLDNVDPVEIRKLVKRI